MYSGLIRKVPIVWVEFFACVISPGPGLSSVCRCAECDAVHRRRGLPHFASIANKVWRTSARAKTHAHTHTHLATCKIKAACTNSWLTARAGERVRWPNKLSGCVCSVACLRRTRVSSMYSNLKHCRCTMWVFRRKAFIQCASHHCLLNEHFRNPMPKKLLSDRLWQITVYKLKSIKYKKIL